MGGTVEADERIALDYGGKRSTKKQGPQNE